MPYRLEVAPHKYKFFYDKDELDRFFLAQQLTQEPTGFTNNANIRVTFDPTTKKVKLEGDFQAYFRGTLVPELTNGWESQPIADLAPTGGYFLAYTSDGFTFGRTPFEYNTIQIAYVYYRADGTYLFTLRETHGFMPWQAHVTFHSTIGTYRSAGGVLEGFTLQSTTATNRRPNTTGVTIQDEDSPTILPGHTSKLYTIAFLQGTGDITSDFNNAEIVRPSAGIPNYNQLSGGNWLQTPMNNGQETRYMCMWQYCHPVADDDGSIRYRYVWLQGQSASTSLAEQEALTPLSLKLGALSTIAPELAFINKVIIRYTAQATNTWDIYSVTALNWNKSNR